MESGERRGEERRREERRREERRSRPDASPRSTYIVTVPEHEPDLLHPADDARVATMLFIVN